MDDLLLERVTSAAMRIMERVERLTALEPSESELNLRQVRLLKALFRRGEMPVGQLSRVIRAPLSTTSEVVGSLVRLGYVEKVRDPEDHRVVRVKLTGKGFEEVGRRLQHQQEAFRRILGDMAPGSRLRFAEALDVLEAVLEEAVLRRRDGEAGGDWEGSEAGGAEAEGSGVGRSVGGAVVRRRGGRGLETRTGGEGGNGGDVVAVEAPDVAGGRSSGRGASAGRNEGADRRSGRRTSGRRRGK